MNTGDYFLLNTERYWGLFYVGACDYPVEFLQNIESVKYIPGDRKVKQHLIDEIGRNRLMKSQFDIYRDVGRIFNK